MKIWVVTLAFADTGASGLAFVSSTREKAIETGVQWCKDYIFGDFSLDVTESSLTFTSEDAKRRLLGDLVEVDERCQ